MRAESARHAGSRLVTHHEAPRSPSRPGGSPGGRAGPRRGAGGGWTAGCGSTTGSSTTTIRPIPPARDGDADPGDRSPEAAVMDTCGR